MDLRIFTEPQQGALHAGRDPSTVLRSAAQVVYVAEDGATLEQRASAIGRDLDELRANGIAGTPAEARERVAAFAERGIARLCLQVLDLSDLQHLDELSLLGSS